MSQTNWTVPAGANRGWVRGTTDGDVQVPMYAWPDPANNNRVAFRHQDDKGVPTQVALNCEYHMDGYVTLKFRYTLPPVNGSIEGDFMGTATSTLPLEPSTSPFPRPGSTREPLLPGETGDEFGQVYIAPPPEFYLQPGAAPQSANVNLIRGDAFTYVTPFAPEEVNPICTTGWLESIGQNTNFGNKMWYTPLLPLYPGDVQDAFLADYAKYNTHLMIQGSLNQSEVRVTCLKARQNGLYAFIFDWEAQTFIDLSDCIDGAIIGLEVDKIGSDRIANGDLDRIISDTCSACVPRGIKVWIHFTSSGGPAHVQHWAFPVPGMSYTDWWAQNDHLGVTGLMYEAWENTVEEDSAGKMGAMMFYARQGLAFSSNCLLCACEIMSVPPFYGEVDGPFSWRRAAEMVCCPALPGMKGVAGSFNGGMRNISTGAVL